MTNFSGFQAPFYRSIVPLLFSKRAQLIRMT
jgi:hypothetical protein